ncbi:MAG: hypothetical protein MUC41_05895 [Syntrophobacteraceae bacterium]|jgi:hypothetical protein|nr:hypothetical protein [Syntrophobacteraceae bacterium]
MRHLLIPLALMVCISALSSCGPARDLAGRYEAVDPRDGQKRLPLELKDDGKGSWKMNHEDFTFTWEERGGEVWLHSKSGGVIAGTIHDDLSIHIALPGVGSFRFEKLHP